MLLQAPRLWVECWKHQSHECCYKLIDCELSVESINQLTQLVFIERSSYNDGGIITRTSTNRKTSWEFARERWTFCSSVAYTFGSCCALCLLKKISALASRTMAMVCSGQFVSIGFISTSNVCTLGTEVWTSHVHSAGLLSHNYSVFSCGGEGISLDTWSRVSISST